MSCLIATHHQVAQTCHPQVLTSWSYSDSMGRKVIQCTNMATPTYCTTLRLRITHNHLKSFISTIHKLYSTAHICLWNSKSNRNFRFTNYLNWKSITFEWKRKENTIQFHHTNIIPQKSSSHYKTSNTKQGKINILHKTSWANNVWYVN